MPLIRLRSVAKAAAELKRGGLVIYPTETAFALGADATNSRACSLVYKVKWRNQKKLLTVIAADATMVKRHLILNKSAQKLAKDYWPGPLTLVLPLRPKSPLKNLSGGRRGLGIRVSAEPIARQLSKLLGRPIVATSANLSGHPNTYSWRSIQKEFGQESQIIYCLSPRTLPRRLASTIIDVRGGTPRVIRQGKCRPKLMIK